MRRVLRILRAVVGLALLGWSTWTILRPVIRHAPPAIIGVDVDTGESYGIRISPLSPAEAAEARAVERASLEEWAVGWSGLTPPR